MPPNSPAPLPEDYHQWLKDLKLRIHESQQRASRSVNQELILLYWRLSNDILSRQDKEGWGAKVIDRLSKDLKSAFPDMKGFSSRNLKYMRSFAVAWPKESFVQEVLAQLPWYHHLALLQKLKIEEERVWYIHQAIKHNWSRNILVMQIESKLQNRTGKAITNFGDRLPKSQSDLARESLKDPYRFDFLGLGDEALERDIEGALIQHISKFLLELGAGFAYVGKQVNIEVGGDDFFMDLLFYHLKLRCYVVIELKSGDFKPEYAGKLNFYLSAVDEQIRTKDDNPTIGLLLCKNRPCP